VSKDYTGSSAPPLNHHDTPEPTNRDRLIGWGSIIGGAILVRLLTR